MPSVVEAPVRQSLAALSAVLISCAWEPKVPNAVEHRGAHVTIVAPRGVRVCWAALALDDALVAVGSRQLGFGAAKHRFLLLPESERDGCSAPRDYRQRCVAPPKASVGARETAFNSLVRGMLWRWHRGSEVLASAIASALGDGSPNAGMWDGAWDQDAQIARGGELLSFASWLVREHGVDKVLAWYRSTQPGESSAIVESRFDRAFARALRDELTRFRANASTLETIGPWLIEAVCAGGDSIQVGQWVNEHRYDVETGRPRDPEAPAELHTAEPAALCESDRGTRLMVERFSLRAPQTLRLAYVQLRASNFVGIASFESLHASWAVVSCDRRRHESGGELEAGMLPVRLDAGRYAMVLRGAAPRQKVWWGPVEFRPRPASEARLSWGISPFANLPVGGEVSYGMPAIEGPAPWLRLRHCSGTNFTIETTPDRWPSPTSAATHELRFAAPLTSPTMRLSSVLGRAPREARMTGRSCVVEGTTERCEASENFSEDALSARGFVSIRSRSTRERVSLTFQESCAE
jgi:hypothetical protein